MHLQIITYKTNKKAMHKSRAKNKREQLMFCGEIPPASVNGVSISSRQILNVLSERFDIRLVEEKRSLGPSRFHLIMKMIRVLFEGVEICLYSIRWRPDIFYSSFPTSVIGASKCLFFIAIYRIFSKGKILLHVHRGDLFSFYYRGNFPRFLVKTCFDMSSTILALSQRQSLAYAEITATPVLVLPNSVNSLHVFWEPPKVSRIVFLSNYLPDKGLDTLLDAFKKLHKNRQIELHCYGGGDSSSYRARIKNESIDNVIIHSILDEKEKYKVLQGYSLLVFPSYNEGQPLVIMEAMAIGLPVVSSNVGLISEMLGEDYPYLVTPRDAQALALAINDCLDLHDPETLSRNLRARHQSFYSPESQRLQIWNAFDPGRGDSYEI